MCYNTGKLNEFAIMGGKQDKLLEEFSHISKIISYK